MYYYYTLHIIIIKQQFLSYPNAVMSLRIGYMYLLYYTSKRGQYACSYVCTIDLTYLSKFCWHKFSVTATVVL